MIVLFLILIAVLVPILHVEALQDVVVLPKLAATATFAGAALIVAGLQLARGRLQLPRWPATIWVALTVFVVVNVAAFASALDWRWSLIGEYQRYQGLATTLLYVLLFAVAALGVRRTRDLRWLLLGVFAAGVGTAIYALMQKAGLDPFKDHFGLTKGRPSATVGQANAFGAYLVAVLGASGFLVLSARQRWQQSILAAGVSLMVLALLFTLSRSAYIAAFAVVIFAVVAAILWYRFYRVGRRPRPRQLGMAVAAGSGMALTVVALGAALFVTAGPGQAAVSRVQSSGNLQDESVGGRISLWRMATRMTIDKPLLGNGQDAFTILFPTYRNRPNYAGIGTSSIAPESAHNFFLDLASGTGVLGLLSFLALVGAILSYAARRALTSDDGELRLALLALGAGLIGYLIAIFFGFSEAMTTWLFWLLLGALAGLLAERLETAPGSSSPRRLAVPAVAAATLAIAGVVAVGWAATLVAADLAASQADHALARGDSAAALRFAGRAVTLNPLQRAYLEQQARMSRLSAPTGPDRVAALQQSVALHETVLQRFEPTAFSVLDLALTEFDLARAQGTPLQDTFPLFDRAIALDPFNVVLKSFVADFYEAQGFPDKALAERLEILGWSQ